MPSTVMTQAGSDKLDPHAPQIAGFRLLRDIGHGGMSVIWLAEEPQLHRQVAIKVMLPEALADEISRRRFENEARTLAKLDHPGIVRIHQVGRTADGLPWYAMPYLANGHVGQRDWRGDEAGVRKVLDALLQALDYAHAHGVIHRDIKAENVLFDDAQRPLLADFGIALRRGYGPRVTGVGLAVGSTAYMPPEQARGHQVDRRADLYSIGVLAWEMLTGKLPFAGADALSMALAHVQQPVPRLPRPLRHWQKFLDTALAKEPMQRFQDAGQMREALAAVRIPSRSRKPPAEAPASTQADAQAARTERPRLPLALGLGVAALGVAALAAWWLWPTPEPPVAQPGVAANNAAAGISSQSPGVMPDHAAEAMLRPVPAHPGEPRMDAAQRQLAAGRLHAPAGDNVLDSLLAASKSAQPHPDIGRIAAQAREQVGKQLEQAIREGDAARAHQLVPVLTSFTNLAGPGIARQRQAQSQRLAQLLQQRISQADKRAIANAWLQLGTEAGLDRRQLQALDRQMQRILEPGDHLPGAFGGARLVQMGQALIGVSAQPVNRSDYARFAEATQRPAAACRARGSLLRVLAPRDWKSPGHSQDAASPVVCVSWDDAVAYAQWFSHLSGRPHRLPRQAEAAHLPAAGGERQVALWLQDCGNDCSEHRINGRSWRNAAGERTLDATRGYDDVGFLLVMEP